MTDERLLVTVAHPDDETFGCGSLLAHATARGVPTAVWCATRGEAGSPAEGSGIAVDDLPEVREHELRAAARLLGVDRVELAGWRDSGMAGDPEPGSLVGAELDAVADAIGAEIERFEPTVVVTLDGSDGHRDHVHVREATMRAVDRRPDLADLRVYWHCLPQALMRRWVDELTRRHPDSEHLDLADLGTPEEQITTVIDTAEHLDRREEAIAAHRSQTSPYEVMPADLRAEFLTAERLTRVRPPWPGGPAETSIF